MKRILRVVLVLLLANRVSSPQRLTDTKAGDGACFRVLASVKHQVAVFLHPQHSARAGLAVGLGGEHGLQVGTGGSFVCEVGNEVSVPLILQEAFASQLAAGCRLPDGFLLVPDDDVAVRLERHLVGASHEAQQPL